MEGAGVPLWRESSDGAPARSARERGMLRPGRGCILAPLQVQGKTRRRTGPGLGDFRRESLGAVRFVPLIGAEGWQEEGDGKPGSLVGARGHGR